MKKYTKHYCVSAFAGDVAMAFIKEVIILQINEDYLAEININSTSTDIMIDVTSDYQEDMQMTQETWEKVINR